MFHSILTSVRYSLLSIPSSFLLIQPQSQTVETFETMDESFAELSTLLQFRDKEAERRAKVERRKEGTLSVEEREMEDWDKEMKVRVVPFSYLCRCRSL